MEPAAQRLLCAPVYAEQPQLKKDTLLSLQKKKKKVDVTLHTSI